MTANVRWRRLPRVLPWALLLLFCVRGVLAMRADGTTVDEPLHLAYGQRGLESGTFLRSGVLNSKMPVSVLNALPLAVDHGRALPWQRQLFLARLPSLLLAVVLGWLVWRWARLLFGEWSGILALFLYTFCPNILAHGHLVTTDIATALAMFAATFCLWRYMQAPSAARLIVAAGVFGAAQLTKVSALFLVPMFVVILAARALGEAAAARAAARAGGAPGGEPSGWRRRAVRALGRRVAQGAFLLLICAVAAVAVLNVGFWFEDTGTPLGRYAFVSPAFRSLAAVPLVRAVPVPVPYAYLQGLDMVARDSRAGDWSYLRGEYSDHGFRSYFLWAFLVKMPLASQILLAIAAWLAVSGRVRAPGAEWCLLAPVGVLLLYLSVFLDLDIGFRYFLPALPFLFVFASRVAAPAAGGAVGWMEGARWKRLAVASLLAWLAVSSSLIHPHYLAYFNEIAGGADRGGDWLIDSNLDWGQDAETVHRLYALHGARPALIDPSGPIAGRIAVDVSNLVGRDPAGARRHAWLRENFRPVAIVGHSWQIFDVGAGDLARCCASLAPTWTLGDLAHDLALDGEPLGGGDIGCDVRFLERLNDGMLGADEPVDAARTLPPRDRSVRGWFGVRWSAPVTIGRVVAFPGMASRGPLARAALALDYVFQAWDGAAWRDIPGTAVTGNRALRVEHSFAPLRTDRIRLMIERERDERGGADPAAGFRAACLELAAYAR